MVQRPPCRFLIPVLLAMLVSACGGPPPTRLERVYEGLADELPRPDPTVLAGRRVLVDPGHGGFFRGTVGRDSLEESEVNLGVSLYLWGLLREAGADVYVTRSMDRDFLTELDSTLAGDLQARVSMSDSLEPDIFISVHHNAQPQRDPDFNRVETYYKAGDPASLDLAFSIHRHLMRNLGIRAGEVRQGNYYVLRNNGVPSVLGESSYLTHPPVEERLKLSEAQRLEAESYFLGILDYFRRGIPRIDRVLPSDSILTRVPVLVYELEDDGGIGIDPDGVTLRVNGDPVVPLLDDDNTRLSYALGWDAPNGNYDVTLSVRNLLGNTSADDHARFVLDFPAAVAVFDNTRLAPGPDGVSGRVRARLLDSRGIPVREGTVVTARSDGGEVPGRAFVRGGRIVLPVIAPPDTRDVTVTLSSGGKDFVTRLERAAPSDPTRQRPLVVFDARDGRPILDASISAGDSLVQSGAAEGVYFVPAGEERLAIAVSAPGYVPVVSVEDADTLRLTPWFDGVLIGRRFVLDPEGGRAIDVGLGKLGLSAAPVNLRMARYLAGFLRGAGASVLMTRTTEEVRTPEDIARMTNRYGADRYIEIRHRAAPQDSALAIRTYHFPGSRGGRALATDLADAMGRRLPHPSRPPASLVTYPLQQTACPAVVIGAPSIGDVDEEIRLDRSWYVREQAYAAFVGILRHFGAPDSGVVEVVAPNGEPDWLVTLDGSWTLLSGPDGRAVFEAIPEGNHTAVLRRAGKSVSVGVTLRGDRARAVAPLP